MPPYITDIGAVLGVVGTALGITNTLWLVFHNRPVLRLTVYWEWSDGPDDASSPRIEIVNVGGRSAYVETIHLAEANGSRHAIGYFNNAEIQPDHKFLYRPDWNEPDDDDPEFRHGWEGLRVVVRSTRGKEWRSEPPSTKPSWFVITCPFDIGSLSLRQEEKK
jgi:hypothetical protein